MRRRVPDRSIDRYRSIGCPKIRPLGRRSGLCTRALLSMAPPGPLTHSRVDVRNRPTKPQSVRLRSHHRTTDRLGGGRSVGRGSERGRPRIDPGLNVSEIRSVGRSGGPRAIGRASPGGDWTAVVRCHCDTKARRKSAAAPVVKPHAFRARSNRARARARRACAAFRGFFFFWLGFCGRRNAAGGTESGLKRGAAARRKARFRVPFEFFFWG